MEQERPCRQHGLVFQEGDDASFASSVTFGPRILLEKLSYKFDCL